MKIILRERRFIALHIIAIDVISFDTKDSANKNKVL